ncbi:MAG TPA: Gfo/Idh/MocA family oxidoreductase [Anaerolineae bacterium]|nr:Gfo/Idh/MocA family oxidoreductase [Anaerolineae bacterium]HIQ04172.1 Gfo/Idh/MocA family oxidoreductase [Anaerolineae bacterium]
MKPLRAGIIGCGQFAQRHAERLAALEDVRLVGFCNRTVEKAIAFNQRYANGQGRVYKDYERMFEELDLDLVYICLPPFAHANEVELACQHGVHFLIEKPIALTMDLARNMAKWVKDSGVKSQVGFMFRHGEAIQWLKAYMHDVGIVGNGFMSARYFCNSLHSWWWRDRSKSGGQLVEQIIHLLDLARFFFGEPARVYSMQENLFHRDVADYTVEDASGTVVRFESGGVAVFAVSNGAIPNRWDYDLRVVLPDLTADFEDVNHAVFHHTGQDWSATTTIASEKDVYLAETLDLLAAIRDDCPTAVPIEEGVRSLALALAAARSAEQDIPIDIALPV